MVPRRAREDNDARAHHLVESTETALERPHRRKREWYPSAMYTLYALWGTPPDQEAFEAYYAETHCPLAAKVPGIRELNLVKTSDGLGDGPPLHYRVAELVFDSKDALEKCQESPEWEALVADAGIMVERFEVTLDNAAGERVVAAA
jgi:uncharacterized protein (TIGR02118 family)